MDLKIVKSGINLAKEGYDMESMTDAEIGKKLCEFWYANVQRGTAESALIVSAFLRLGYDPNAESGNKQEGEVDNNEQ